MTREEKIQDIIIGLTVQLSKNQEVLLSFLAHTVVHGMPSLAEGSDEAVDAIYQDYKERGIVL